MALEKITEEQMDTYGICAAPDILSGTAAENKALFDRMIRQLVVPAVNACIEAANKAGSGGAGGDGASGADGFSPVVEMTKADGVTTITITDKDSVQTTTIEDGEDGVSPTIDVSKSGKVTTLTIKDAEGTKTVNINDGADGADGEDGTDGSGEAAEEVPVEDIDLSAWDSGSFEMTYEDGTTKEGSVEFDAYNRPTSITLNGHTMTLTLPEV